jgi:hypothetical protein
MKGFMINCKEATELVVKRSGEKLGFWIRIKLWMHLSLCKFCGLFEKQNKFIDHHIRKMDEQALAEMNSEVKNKILHTITNSGNATEY